MPEKILVVDDSKLVTDIVRMRLSMYGYDVELAHSGEEALAKIATDVPDLMVLDVQMPGIDGYGASRRLRDDPSLDDLRIIMLTSSDDKHAAFEDGVDDYLNKDIDLLNLPNPVKLMLEMQEPMIHAIRVIVVDDSALMRRVITGLLEQDPSIQVVATARN